ncbi:MAG: HAD-IA family hydrolase [Methanocalculaceae archaeon]|jgi:HAD superfamily hydrolase (TIGR01509 family)|nr:HAD-IA family hydrolase [Methanocalculaceae archaeon]
MPLPRAVIFDLDNTLHSLIAARLTAVSAVAAWTGNPEGDLPFLFLHNDKPAMVEDVLTAYLADLHKSEHLSAADWLYHTLERSCITPFPGIPDLLAELRNTGIRLAVITNSDPAEAHLRLELLGITGFFDHVVTPDTFGIKKPDPAVYQKTLDLLGVTAGEAVMIGDRLDRDVTPAREAGMRAVHAAYGSFKKGENGAVQSPGELRNILLLP